MQALPFDYVSQSAHIGTINLGVINDLNLEFAIGGQFISLDKDSTPTCRAALGAVIELASSTKHTISHPVSIGCMDANMDYDALSFDWKPEAPRSGGVVLIGMRATGPGQREIYESAKVTLSLSQATELASVLAKAVEKILSTLEDNKVYGRKMGTESRGLEQ